AANFEHHAGLNVDLDSVGGASRRREIHSQRDALPISGVGWRLTNIVFLFGPIMQPAVDDVAADIIFFGAAPGGPARHGIVSPIRGISWRESSICLDAPVTSNDPVAFIVKDVRVYNIGYGGVPVGHHRARRTPLRRRFEQLHPRTVHHREEAVPNVAILVAADLLAQARRAPPLFHPPAVARGPPHPAH